MKFFLFFVTVFFIASAALPGVAQQQLSGKSPDSAFPLDFRTQDAPSDSSTPLVPYQFDLPGHEPITFNNLFRLYWKSGLVKPDNREAIEEYLKVSECQIYQANFKNDFLWPDILKSTTTYIQNNRGNFTSSFTFVQPIFLDRYDPYKQWFVVTPDTQYLNVMMMTFADYNSVHTECDTQTQLYPKTVPRKAIIKWTQPFSLTYLHMTPDFANQYIQYMDSKEERIDIGGISRDRHAYIQFYFTVTGLDLERTKGNTANFLGTLDGYVIYADKTLTMPLFEWVRHHEPETSTVRESDNGGETSSVPAAKP